MWIDNTNAFRFFDQSLLWLIRNSLRPHSRTVLMRLIVLQVDLPLLVPLFGLFLFDTSSICFWLVSKHFVYLGSKTSAMSKTMFVTCSVPSWRLFLCSLRKYNSSTWRFHCTSNKCFVSKFNCLLPILPWARLSPCWSINGENWGILLFFGISFSALRDFISSANCSGCNSLKMRAYVISLSSTLSFFVAGLCPAVLINIDGSCPNFGWIVNTTQVRWRMKYLMIDLKKLVFWMQRDFATLPLKEKKRRNSKEQLEVQLLRKWV